MDLEAFYYACDCDSQESSDFASTLYDVFELEDRSMLFENDEYVEFSLLQVTKEFKGSRLWIEPVNMFIDKRFNTIYNIFMVLKAFPIEYTGIIDEDFPAKNYKDFVARQNAMLRFYTRVLHVKQILGQFWLYKNFMGLIIKETLSVLCFMLGSLFNNKTIPELGISIGKLNIGYYRRV